jgi:hypothetical protein
MADDSGTTARWRYGLIAVIGGFVALVVCFGLSIWRYPKAPDAAWAPHQPWPRSARSPNDDCWWRRRHLSGGTEPASEQAVFARIH